MPVSGALLPVVTAGLDRELPPALAGAIPPLLAAIRRRLGGNLQAVLLYGSCLRAGEAEGIVDFYALVDNWQAAFPGLVLARAGRLLPPSTLFLEAPPFRCKASVLPLWQFAALCRPEARHASVWARFIQPAVLVYAAGPGSRRQVLAALCSALAAAAIIAPVVPQGCTPGEYWRTLFTLTYRAELRAEDAGKRAADIYRCNARHYDDLLPLILGEAGGGVTFRDGRLFLSQTPEQQHRARRKTGSLVRTGRILHALRLVKDLYCFSNGMDYMLWKIFRHTGERISLPGFVRRHPLLCAPWILLVLGRRGVFPRRPRR